MVVVVYSLTCPDAEGRKKVCAPFQSKATVTITLNQQREKRVSINSKNKEMTRKRRHKENDERVKTRLGDEAVSRNEPDGRFLGLK